ncbi:HEAT repeat domain-containing protein [Thermodesulfobacteriota bacterium]
MINVKSVWLKLDDIEMEEPSETLKKNFENMINSYSLGMNNNTDTSLYDMFSNWLDSWWPKRPLTQFAATVAVLIIGLVTGLNINEKADSKIEELQNGVNNLHQVVMASLLNESSAMDRINGLTMTGQLTTTDQLKNVDRQFYSTLLLLLNSDSNVNVRMAAVNALANFADNDYVRHELVKSLSLQSSPLVQVSLIDLLASIKEPDSSSTLVRLINDPGTNVHVKERAKTALKEFI